MRSMIPAPSLSGRRAKLTACGPRCRAAFDGPMAAVPGCPWMMDDLTAFDRSAA
jgi:hypothetical protein